MTRTFALFFTALLTVGSSNAFAQETGAGPGRIEVSVVPAGATFFQSEGLSPSFGNYSLGGSLVFNVTPIIGFEAEASGTLGNAHRLQFGDLGDTIQAPNTVTYTGNIVFSAPARHGLVPYATIGGGGFTMFKEAGVGVNETQTLATGNMGAGLKWYAPNSRWGLRADYRFIAVASQDDAPEFFGREMRYGHRVYGGVLINLLK